MTELIVNWLMNTVGCKIKCSPETLGQTCFDGKLFAEILVAYNVCSSDYLKLINHTLSTDVALSNLKQLCVWFKLLGIHISDQFLNDIVNKSGSACLRLLYELFIRLENRESIYYIDSKKKNWILSQPTDKFQVIPVPDEQPKLDMVGEKQYLHDILNNMKGVMYNAEKATVKRFLLSGMKNRAELMKKEILKNKKICSYKKQTFPNLDIQAKINEFEELLSSPEGIDNMSQQYKCSPENYILYLKLKRRKMEADKKLKLHLEKNAMQDAWRKILSNQETELKNILSTKLLKQSEYEKQMILRLKRMRLKYKKFIDNKNMVMDMVEKQETVNQFKSTLHSIQSKEKTFVEKERIKELHQRLYKEKMRLKMLRDNEACRRIMEDIVDYAMLKHDYLEKNGINMPRKMIIETKYLFLKGVRLLPHNKSSQSKSLDEISSIKIDDERIQELADCEYHLYMYQVGPWFLFRNLEEDHEQLNIIGFIVHRLLNLKYNLSLSVGTAADLPSYTYKIFLQHINDTVELEKLKQYLAKFQIDVIDVFTVINHFLNAYKTNTGIEDIKQTAKVATPLKSKTADIEKKVGMGSKISGRNRRDKYALDKCLQFPSNEGINRDINNAESVKLGKYAYQTMQSGGLLPDAFICTLIIQYLKTLKNINGWVLLNYPENITQVAILEYMFTGLEVPFMPKVTDNIRRLIDKQLHSVMQNEDKKKVNSENNLLEQEEEDEMEENYSLEELVKLQNSNILPKPNLPSVPPVFQSFFTKVVILKRETETKKVVKKNLTPLISQPLEGEEDKITLEYFYDALGNSSYFNYKSFDHSTLKRLLRLVLCVSSSQKLEFSKHFDKEIGNIPLQTPYMPDEKKDILKPPEFVKIGVDKWVKMVFEENGEKNLEETTEEEDLEEDILIYPGHKDWEYTELPIPEIYAPILATVWESIEYFFINNLKECFGLLRTVRNRLMPYRNYIRRKAEECLTLDDDRAQAVTNFQLMLNGIDNHHRSMNSMKNELHYRVLKLQCNLWRMTDVKKFYCDQVMELIKSQDWIASHLVNLLRVYSFVLQVEVDRFADTMQLIEDYYSICLLGYPQEDRMTKLVLPIIRMKADGKEKFIKQSSTATSSASKKNHSFMLTKNIQRDTKRIKSQDNLRTGWKQKQNSDLRTALYYADFEMKEKPILSMLLVLITRLKKSIFQIKNNCKFNSNIIIDKFKKHARAVTELETKSYNVQKEKVTKPTSTINQNLYESEALIGPLEIAVNKVFLEWSVAIDNEANRVLYRIDLIKKKAIADTNEDTTVIDETFKMFKEDIAYLYHCQILNTDKVCDLMRAAIEEETKIQPLIILQNDRLEVDPSVILYPDAPPPPPPSLNEMSTEFKFTISQLTNLFYKLVYVAPFGIIEQTFVQILEDMACMGHEMGHCYLPQLWSSLSSSQIKDIVHRLFGDKAIIDWRLFIIFGLDISFPTLECVLEMKKNFAVLDTNFTETVTYEQYSCVLLWFEDAETFSIEQDLYYAKAKELLFKIFQISDNVMNYTDFLLAFCRDIDSREGFVKALALVEGCATVAWKQDLFRETFQIEKENEKYNVAFGILTIVLAGVFQVVDSVIITELMEEEHQNPNQSSGMIKYPSVSEKRNTSKAKIKRIVENQHPSLEETLNLQVTITEPDYMDVGCNRSYKIPHEEKKMFTEIQKPSVIWKSDVYFSTVFSLLILDIHNFALYSDQIYDPIDMEDNLRRIFIHKGTGHSMKLFTLFSETYIQKLFSSYRCFQAISLSELLMKLLDDS